MSNTEIKRDLYRDKVLELMKESGSFLPAIRFLRQKYFPDTPLGDLIREVTEIRHKHEINNDGPWIRVSKEPEPYQYVLVHGVNGNDIAQFKHGIYYIGLEKLQDVTHWMPLPTPPKQ